MAHVGGFTFFSLCRHANTLGWLSALIQVAAAFDPFGELLALFPNVDKTRPRFQYLEGISHVILVNLSLIIQETLLPLALKLSSPDIPLDRS